MSFCIPEILYQRAHTVLVHQAFVPGCLTLYGISTVYLCSMYEHIGFMDNFPMHVYIIYLSGDGNLFQLWRFYE